MDPWEENWDDEDEDVCDSDSDDDYDDTPDWWEKDVPDNCRDFGDESAPSASSSGAKKSNQTNRPKKTKSKPEQSKKVRKDEEKEAVKPRRSNLKVEMRSVFISNDIKNQIMSTLRSIHGENFSLDTDVAQSRRKLDNRYWVDQGQLIIRNCYNFAKKKNPNEPEVNSILLETLESYGFFTKHCHEALVRSKNNLEESIKLLLNFYFGIEYASQPNEAIMKNAAEMDDELVALKAIYENMIEEKVVHKHWIFHLELPHLAEWHFQSAFNVGPNSGRSRSGREKPPCRNFSLSGKCRFGANCRFSHEPSKNTKKSAATDEQKRKSSFDLEIRFPDECAYPNGIPIILFVAQHPEFSKHSCLRVTKLLLKEASIRASQGFAYCYNLVDLLLNSGVLDWLKKEAESAINIDMHRPLFNDEAETFAEDESPSSSSAVAKPKHRKTDSRSVVSNRDDDVIRNMKQKYHSPDYKNMVRSRKNLPAWNSADDILNLLEENQVVVVVGETGCGKSTQIPQFILDEWLYPAAGVSSFKSSSERVEIICTQPRRISAIGVASRVAQERLERVGEVVGYQISLESSISSLTKLIFCTTGILLKKLVGDPLLESVTHVIVDEVHERSEESDFLLLILKELLEKRKDLKVILMSATLNAGLFSTYFGGAPLIEIPGKMFPVSELYLEDMLEQCDYVVDEYSKNCRKMSKTMTRTLDDIEYDLALAESCTKETMSKLSSPDECLTVKQLFYRYKDYSVKTRKTILMMDHEKVDPELIVSVLSWIVDGKHQYPREGSILVFLPGMADITAVNDELRGHATFSQRNGHFLIIPLHSSISNEEQSLVFKKTPKGVRKVVLSTNIAETSITIDDCVFVVDCGKMKENRFDTNKNMSSLDTVWISKANAHQRRGRAGRVMPGLCIRLYTRHRFQNVLDPQPIPEIRRVPLDQIVLFTRSLVNFQLLSIESVLEKLIEPPYANNISTAIERLQNIGALDAQNELTALGRHLSVLPVDVKIGKLILFGAVFCCLDSVLTIAASLSNKSPFLSPFSKRNEAETKKREFAICNSDHLTVLNAYKKWQEQSSFRGAKRFAEENFLSWRTLDTMADLKHQYLELLIGIGFVTTFGRMRRRPHEDCVLKITPPEFNKNGNNYRLLSSIICAALYPNLVEVLTPDKVYKPGVSGSMPSEHSADDLRFKTRKDGFVNLHPASVNHGVSKFISPYLVYQEKMKTSRVFIHDSTMVHVISLILFAGAELKIELNSGLYIASLEDGWLSFSFRSLEDGKMLQHMRLELNRLLEKKIENPHEHLINNPEGNRIISTITDIISKSTT